MEDEQQCKYVLSKISENWFDLRTDTIYHVRRVLEQFICPMCLHRSDDEFDFTLPENYDTLDDEEKVWCLLSTSCGAEFVLSIDGEEPTYELVEEL